MNVKILTCLLVVVAYSEAGSIFKHKLWNPENPENVELSSTHRPPASRYIPDDSTQNEDEDVPEYIKHLFSDMDDDSSPEGLHDEHGRRGPLWDKIVNWFQRHLFTPIANLLDGGDEEAKKQAIQIAELKIEQDRIKAEEELTHAIMDQQIKKLNAQIESLNNQMEIMKIDAAKNEEKVKEQHAILERMTKEEIAKVKIEVMEKVQKELNVIVKKEKDGGAPSVAATGSPVQQKTEVRTMAPPSNPNKPRN